METFFGNQNSITSGTFLDSQYLNPDYLLNKSENIFLPIISFVVSDQAYNIFKTLLFFLTIFFLTIIFYTIIRLFEIRKKEHAHLHHEIHEYAHNKKEQEKRLREQTGGSKNVQWSKVLNYLFSQHSSDWKLAVVEADSMLFSLLDYMGFKGASLGDKLKSADRDSFPELTIAWEVHTIRNRIAHEGMNFELSQHEAKRIIALYEEIFHMYGYI